MNGEGDVVSVAKELGVVLERNASIVIETSSIRFISKPYSVSLPLPRLTDLVINYPNSD